MDNSVNGSKAAEFVIREAVAGDEAALLDLIRELAAYEEMAADVVASEPVLRYWLFEKRSARAMLMEETATGRPIGYVIYFYNFSTFLGRSGIYIEDIYVKPEWRGHGIGSKVFSYLRERGAAEGCGRLEWQVLDWNESSIYFYEGMGAKPLAGWTQYRLVL